MIKRTILLFTLVFSLAFIVSCGEETTTPTTTAITTSLIELPNLTGLNEEAAQTALSGLDITVVVEYEENTTVEDALFVRYGNNVLAGDLIAPGSTVTVYFSINYPELPDLSGNSKSEIISILTDLELDYIFVYETNTELAENTFISYGGDDQIGTTISDNHEIIVVLATPRLVLPDLTGQNQSQIISALLALHIDFVIEIITDNEVPDQTFSGYADGLEAGDLIPSTYEITVYLGFNSTRLPDLSGLQKEEITSILNLNNIIFNFQYTVNDDYPEDSFASYEGLVAGDFYEEGTITVNLYKNTFTDNETSIFFSKYVDGGNDTSDQAIEIYNPTDSTVNLGDYHILIYINGSYDFTYEIDLGDIDLLPGETYVIANSNANANILVKADLITADLVFDGNDTIQLCYSNGTYIDTIYNIGNKEFVMNDEVFIRNINVEKGSRNYIFTQWYGFIPTYTEVLGTHPIVIPTKIEIQITTRPFDDPLGGMDFVTLDYINDGDTASFTPGFLSDERVRFLGVDTPETYPVVDPWGPEAKAYTTLILTNAQHIYIQSDPDLGYTETYGRHLGLVWVDLGTEGLVIDILSSTGEVMRTETLSGWILLNYYLVLNGYSYNYYSAESNLVFSNRYLVRWFQEAERFAQENGLGVHE